MKKFILLALIGLSIFNSGWQKVFAQPAVPSGFTIREVASGGLLAGQQLVGIVADPTSANQYVAASTSTGYINGFKLYRIDPSGAVSLLGTYPFVNHELVKMAWGPNDHKIYAYNGIDGTINTIDPVTGASSVFATIGGFSRFGLNFDPNGNLIFSPEAVYDFYKIISTGLVHIGSINPSIIPNGNHGDAFGIQSDGSYIVYSDNCNQPMNNYSMNTTGHVDGTPFTSLNWVGTTDLHTLYNPSNPNGGLCGYSDGAIDPETGDIYSITGNFGLGITRIAFTPADGGASTVFVSGAGNGSTNAGNAQQGILDLTFGRETGGGNCNSLYFVDRYNNKVYEVPMNNCCTPQPDPVVVSGGGTFCGSATITATGGNGGTIYFQGTISRGTSIDHPLTSEIISSSGTYYFRALSANGCWGKQGSTTVKINPKPDALVISPENDISFCPRQNTITTLSVPTVSYSQPITYNIPLANLINLPYDCGSSASKYNGAGVVGFSWDDVGNGVVTNVQVKLSVGVECSPGVHTTTFNSASTPSFTTTLNWCQCNSPSSAQIFTISFTPSDYNVGGVNSFLINATNNFGLVPASALEGYYAQVTITYSAPPVLWSPGNETTNNITVSPSTTTTYTVTVTGGNGCSSSSSKTIKVEDTEAPIITCPAPVTINASPGLCNGTTTLIPPTVTDNCDAFGNALSFDGGYVDVPDAPLLTPFNEWTLETWVRRTTTGAQQSLIEKYMPVDGTYGYLLRILDNDKAMAGFVFNSYAGYFITGATTILPNAWYHLAMTVNRTTGEMKLYVNGVLDAQVTGMTGLPVNPSTGSLKLGARGDDANTRLINGGLMDEVRIWNVERTQAQIQAGMNSELSAQAGLVALYHLNQGIAGGNNTGLSTATDASGNGNNGSLVSFALTGPTSNWVNGHGFGLTLTNDAPAIYPIGNTDVTWTATDGSGNSTTCTQTVTVVDNQAPVLTCPDNQVLNAIANTCAANYTVADPISDNCTGSTWGYILSGATTGTVSGIADGTGSGTISFNKGITTVTLTGSDGVSSAAACSFTVTVADNEPPTIICAAPVVINTTTGLCTGTTTLSPPTVSDNCSNSFGNALSFDGGYVDVPNDASLNPLNEWTIETWVKRTNTNVQESLIEKYSQAYGVYGYLLRIGNNASAGFVISSNGGYFITGTTTILPNVWYHLAATFNRITGELKLYVNGVLDAQLTGITGLPTTPSAGSLKIGARGDDANTRLSNGGLMDEIRVWNVERTQAQIQAGMNSELGAQPGLVALYHLNQGLAGGTNTGLTTAIDVSGNSNNGTLINFALTGPTSNWVSGQIFGLTLTNNAPDTYPIGNTNVTWIATDGSGNSATCTQVVTVVDNQQPVITCPVSGNTNRNTNAGVCTYKAVSTEFNATATDNCGATSLTYKLTGATTGTGTTLAGVVFNKGVTMVTWTASDGVTANVTCSFTVTVADNQQPIIICPVSGNTNRNTNAGVCTYKAVLTEFNATATDNCAVTSLTYALTGATTGTGTTLAGVVFNKGVTIVTWTASDGVTTNVICSFTVMVVDSEKPVITSCPSVPIQCYSATGTYPVPSLTATDNCGVQSIGYVITGVTSRNGNSGNASGIFNPGTSTIAWKVTDLSGNTATCTTIVRIDKIDATIPDVYASGITSSIGSSNTIYIGYGGTSITLTAPVTSSLSPNSFTYKWTTGSPAGPAIATTQSLTVSPSATTTYFVSVKDANNCAPLVQVKKQINVVDIRCGSGKVNVCQFKNGTYSTVCVSSTTKNITSLPAGSYLGVCAQTITAKDVITEEKYTDQFEISANPNPSNHSFNVTVNSSNKTETIFLKVINVNGQLLETRKINSAQTFKLGEIYRPGIYLVEVTQGKERKTLKLIKQ